MQCYQKQGQTEVARPGFAILAIWPGRCANPAKDEWGWMRGTWPAWFPCSAKMAGPEEWDASAGESARMLFGRGSGKKPEIRGTACCRCGAIRVAARDLKSVGWLDGWSLFRTYCPWVSVLKDGVGIRWLARAIGCATIGTGPAPAH